MKVPGQYPAASRVSWSRAALTVVIGLALAGALLGALWAWLAPPIHGVVALTKAGDRIKAYLGDESEHWFTAAALMVGMVTAMAVIAAVLVWQWQAHRGPVMAAALAVGSLAASGAAVGVGALVARVRYGVIDIAAAPVSGDHRVHYVVEAPSVFFGPTPLQIALTILGPAAAAAMVYLLLALSSPREDLGAWPPMRYPVVAATGRIATADDGPPAAPSPPVP
ncbi:DUF2567 domain-containing protein [Mycolicibacterium xanthum]|uniref:DUF2567 domain-containing protein n=1 Tax=Mycolicibacterium xanthum TaxID=2796469 RepID=UPI002107A80B|nr:DUF2567 domain-containing protein [Mycolicibacterium xanthum]